MQWLKVLLGSNIDFVIATSDCKEQKEKRKKEKRRLAREVSIKKQ
jgi:hypothetical protein